MTREAAVVATDVVVEIEGKRILDQVSITARRGEVLALLGPNGAGKSTLLSAIAGDQAIQSGSVQVAGRMLRDWNLKELARERSVLLQQNTVFFPFTVGEIVAMGRAPWRRTEREAEDDEAVADALARTDMTRFTPRVMPSLSGGERARASFARVLAQRTGVLLLDEPTAALDLRHQEDVLGMARERSRAGDAVVVVLHDLNLAAAYADSIVLLAEGRVAASGAPDEVLTAPLIERVYRQRVDVFPHPTSGVPLIVPVRDRPNVGSPELTDPLTRPRQTQTTA